MRLSADNREAGTESVLKASPICEPLNQLVLINGRWEGTATALPTRLNAEAGHGDKPPRGWPGSARWLATMIKEIAPAMRTAGTIDAQLQQNTRPEKWVIRRLNEK